MPKYKYECPNKKGHEKETDLPFPAPFCQTCQEVMRRVLAPSRKADVLPSAAPQSVIFSAVLSTGPAQAPIVKSAVPHALAVPLQKPVAPHVSAAVLQPAQAVPVRAAVSHPLVLPLHKPVALASEAAVHPAPALPRIARPIDELSVENCFRPSGQDDRAREVGDLFQKDLLLARSIKPEELHYYTDPVADWMSHGCSFTLISPNLPQYLFEMGEDNPNRVLAILVDSSKMLERILRWSSVDAAFNPNIKKEEIQKLVNGNSGKNIAKELHAFVDEIKSKQRLNGKEIGHCDIQTGQITAGALVGLIFCPRINPFKAQKAVAALRGLVGPKTVALPVFYYFVKPGGAELKYTNYSLAKRL